jgi:DNA-binding transcriptional LysR family regulator
MCLVVSAAHRWAGKKRIAKKDLLGEPFLVREDGSGTLASLQASLAQAGMRIDDLNVVARIGSNEAIRQGVKNHMGVSVLSAISVQDDVAAGYLRTLAISGLDLKRAFYLTQHRQRSLSPIGQAFNLFVENQIADDQTTRQSR